MLFVEDSPKDKNCFPDVAILSFFGHSFDFFIKIKHRDQLLSTTLKDS